MSLKWAELGTWERRVGSASGSVGWQCGAWGSGKEGGGDVGVWGHLGAGAWRRPIQARAQPNPLLSTPSTGSTREFHSTLNAEPQTLHAAGPKAVVSQVLERSDLRAGMRDLEVLFHPLPKDYGTCKTDMCSGSEACSYLRL